MNDNIEIEDVIEIVGLNCRLFDKTKPAKLVDFGFSKSEVFVLLKHIADIIQYKNTNDDVFVIDSNTDTTVDLV